MLKQLINKIILSTIMTFAPATVMYASDSTQPKQKNTINSDYKLDGYMRDEVKINDTETTNLFDVNLTYKPTKKFRITFDSLLKYSDYNEIDSSALTFRALTGASNYFMNDESFDLYGKINFGLETKKLFESVNSLDANKLLLGIQTGIAIPKFGTKLLLTGTAGIGETKYELLSGYKDQGTFNSLFASAQFGQNLFGKGIRNIKHYGSFHEIQGEQFNQSIYLNIMGYISKDNLSDLTETITSGIRIEIPILYNVRGTRTDLDGLMMKLAPFISYDSINSESTTKKLREITQLGINMAGRYKNFGAYIELGYNHEEIKTNDTPREYKNGLTAKIGIYFDF